MKVVNWLAGHWLKVIGYFVGAALVLGMLFFKLDSLVPGYATAERTAVNQSMSLRLIVDHPLNAPHKFLQWTAHKAGQNNPLVMRGISALLGVACIVLFYLLLRLWHTERIALFGSAMLLTSSWFLHTARLATPDIVPTLLILIMLICVYLGSYTKRKSNRLLWLFAAAFTASLYFPGMPWLLAGLLAWKGKTIINITKDTKFKQLFMLGMIVTAFLTPLLYGIVRNPFLLKAWLLLPDSTPNLLEVGRSIIRIPASLFIQADPNPLIGLADLPLLEVLSGILFALGLYYWEREMSTKRLILASATTILGLLVFALNYNRETYSMLLLPFVYLCIVSGITVLLQQWFAVFPRNPLARSIGIATLVLAIGASAYYHATRYYIAWPNATETRQTFSIKQ